MATPNFLGANLILGHTSGNVLTTPFLTTILNNASGSGTIYKVNTVNMNNQSNITVLASLFFHTQAGQGGTTLPIVSNISIPSGAAFTAIERNTQYYLEENTSLSAQCPSVSGNSAIVVTASYEEIR